MSQDANHIRSAFLAPTGQGGKDIFGGHTALDGVRNALDHGDINGNSAAIKPVLDVFSSRGPLQITGFRVRSVLVLMMNNIETKGIWNESFGDKAVDQDCSDYPLFSEFRFGIPVSGAAINTKSCSGISWPNFAVDIPAYAFDAPHIADFVKGFITSNGLPFFAGEIFDGIPLRGDPENLFQRRLNVELVSFSALPRATEVDNFISPVHGRLKNFLGNLSSKFFLAVSCFSRETFNTASVRDFIKTFISRKAFPNFIFHFLSPSVLSFAKEQYTYRSRPGLVKKITCLAKSRGSYNARCA